MLRNSEPGFVSVRITEHEMEFPVLVVDFEDLELVEEAEESFRISEQGN